MRRVLVGMRMGPFTRSWDSFARFMRSLHTVERERDRKRGNQGKLRDVEGSREGGNRDGYIKVEREDGGERGKRYR